MSIWYNKKEEELIQRLKITLESESLQFVGKFISVEEKDFGFFKDVRSTSGVRKYYPTNEGEPDDFNYRQLEVWSKKTILFNSGKRKLNLEEGKWYKFYAVPAQSQLRLKNRNPFLLQTDLTRAVDISLFRGYELIENIQKDSINTPESVKGKLTRSIEAISNEINTQPATFIFELIQNADDYPNEEKYVKMSFDIKSPYLLIKHNGSPFDVNNAVAICDINEGDKRNEVEKIGFKGIGFKSIFKDCNLAYLKSGEYSFRFDEIKWRNEGRKLFWQITPINTEEKEFQNILKPFNNVNLVIKPKEPRLLSNYKFTLLEHFKDERILLFLRNVKEIDFILNDDSFRISNTDNKWRILKSNNIIVDEGIREELNRGIALNDKRIPIKYQSIEKTEIGFGFLVNENKVQSVDDATIYAYLPTKVNLGLGFLLNGNFIPDGSRTHLHQDLSWNDFLFEKAGELLPDKLIELIKADIDKQSILDLIPNFDKLTDINDDEKIQFIEVFKKGFDKKITTTQFIPTKSGSLETLSNILIDETGLFEFLGDEFAQLTGISEKLIDSNAGEGIEKIKELINQHSVGVLYDVDRLKDDIKTKLQDWLKQPTNNLKFIEHFSSNESLKGLLKTEEIVLSNLGELCKASDIFFEVPEELSFLSPKQVSKEILVSIKDKEDKIEFKVFEPIQFFKDNILGKAEKLNSILINETNLIQFWYFIFKNWDFFEGEKEILNCLSSIEILCKSETTDQLSKCIISKSYISAEFNLISEIESTVRSILTDARFISDKYISNIGDEPKWRKIFHQLGAIGDLQKAIGDLLPKLSNINEQQHFIIAKQIFKYWKENKEKETRLSEAQIELISNSLKLKCIDNVYRETSECIISDHFQTNKIINTILNVVSISNQISSDYSNTQISEWNTFFKEIGCAYLEEKQNVLDAKLSLIVSKQDELLDSHLEYIKGIYDLYNARNTNGLDFDFVDILSKIKLKTIDNEFKIPFDIHLSSIYKPKIDIQTDAELIESNIKYLSHEYFELKIDKYFLIKIGINETFRFYKTDLKRDEIPTEYRTEFENRFNYIVQNASAYGRQHRLVEHIDLNYKSLLTTYKYSLQFWEEVTKPTSKFINYIFQKSTYKTAFNTFVFENYIINFLKNNKTLPNQLDDLNLPTQMFSFKLTEYISDKSVLPKYDFSELFYNDDKTESLESILGIKSELSPQVCIELLSRTENHLTIDEISNLGIVDILVRYKPSIEEIESIYLPNVNLVWRPISQVFITNDNQFKLDSSQKLHEHFNSIAETFGVKELSEETLLLKVYPEAPDISVDMVVYFKEKAKFIAFKIDQINWQEIESNIIEQLSSFKFYEVDFIANVFPRDQPIYEHILDFYYVEDKNEVFYKGVWKNNKRVIEFLHSQFQSEKIELVWFDNIINRWDDKKIIETLLDMFGSIPPDWIKDSLSASVDNDSDSDTIDKDPFWENLTESDIKFIKDIIGGEYELNEQIEANLAAKIKTLMIIKDEYSKSELSDEEYYLKAGNDEIIVRSAQRGLLFLDLHHWNRLNEINVKLAILTNNQISFFNSQQSLYDFTKDINKYGIMKLPVKYSLDDLNSIGKTTENGKWHFVFIVNENTQAAKKYIEVMNLDDYNF
jgi:hypothetical protein